MTRLFMFLVLVGSVSLGASTAFGDTYVALYGDAARTYTSASPLSWTDFNLWVWWLPAEQGLQSTEFHLSFPANAATTMTIQNPDLAVILDCPGPGVVGYCASFNTCQTDWVWTHHLICWLTREGPGYIEVGPLAGESKIWAVSCVAGSPPEAVTVLNKFGIWQNSVIAVEGRTWGAIKSLYR